MASRLQAPVEEGDDAAAGVLGQRLVVRVPDSLHHQLFGSPEQEVIDQPATTAA